MKCCFIFRAKGEQEKLAKFLENDLNCTISRDYNLSYPILLVKDEEYAKVITEGTIYCIKNDICCSWIDYDGKIEQLQNVPLAYAEIGQKDKKSNGLWKFSTKLKLKTFTKKCTKILGQKITFEQTPCYDVRFYIKRNENINELHYYLRTRFSRRFLKKYADSMFLPNAVLCDFYGKHISQLKDTI